MKRKFALAGIALLTLFAFGPAIDAQMGTMQTLTGVWSPTIGVGSTYEFDSGTRGKATIEIAIVGAQTIGGKPGHWMEMTMSDPRQGRVVMKMLSVLENNIVVTKRLIMQMPGMDPMEFPMDYAAQFLKNPPVGDARTGGTRVGTESVTTPAGTFECEHWRSADNASDIWISTQVAPYGTVKMTGAKGNMTLIKLTPNYQSKITRPVQSFDPSKMGR